MIKLKYIFIAFILCSLLFSQINQKSIKIFDLPDEISTNGFQPSNICVNTTGYYLLDNTNRQIAYISTYGEVIYSGGYGIENDAFIDPIDIVSDKLSIWLVDRSENKLLEFDYRLNYLRSVEFDYVYPEFSGIDNWGNLFLLSEQDQQIYKAYPPVEYFEEFIDFSLVNNFGDITDLHVAWDGSIAVLGEYADEIFIFDRLGNLHKKLPISELTGKFLIKIENVWFMITEGGNIISLRDGVITALKIEQQILDVTQLDGKLYILFSNQIWVVNVSKE